MIIFWRGVGFPILLAGIAVSAVAEECFGHGYMSVHIWPRPLVFGAGGAVIFFLAHLRAKGGSSDSVYWIPMGAWATLFVLIGIIWCFGPSGAQVAAREIPAESESSNHDYHYPIPAGAYPNANPKPAASPYPTASAYPQQPATPRIRRGVQLQAILYPSPGHGTAIINDTTVSVGDKVGFSTVTDIEPQFVTLQGTNGKLTTLKLSDVSR